MHLQKNPSTLCRLLLLFSSVFPHEPATVSNPAAKNESCMASQFHACVPLIRDYRDSLTAKIDNSMTRNQHSPQESIHSRASFILVVDGQMARNIKSYLLVNLIYKRGTILKTFRGLQSYQCFVCWLGVKYPRCYPAWVILLVVPKAKRKYFCLLVTDRNCSVILHFLWVSQHNKATPYVRRARRRKR